jgi:hypothetical protein
MTSRPSKRLSIRSIRIRSVPGSDSKSMHVKTRIINGEKSVEIKALIDSGAQGNFMDEEFAKKHRIPIVRLKKEIRDWWLPLLSNNLGLSLGHQIYNRSIFVKGISMAISLIFHCDFSIVCLSISLGYFKCMPGDFIGIFQ